MKRYSQAAVLHPATTLLAWVAVAIGATATIAIFGSAATMPFAPPAAALGLALVLAVVLVMRSWQGVMGTLLVIAAALAVVFAAASLTGAATGSLGAIAVLVTGLAVVQATYVGLAHRRRIQLERRRSRPLPGDRRYLLSEALRDIRPTIVLGAVVMTFVFGILAIAGAETGLLALGGIATSIAVMTILPAILALAPTEFADQTSPLEGVIRGIAGLGARMPVAVLVVAAGLVIAGFVAVVHAGVSVMPMCVAAGALWFVAFLGLGSPVRAALALLSALPPMLLAYVLFPVALPAAIVFAIAAIHVLHVFKAWGGAQDRGDDRVTAAIEVAGATGVPIVVSSFVAGIAFASLILAGEPLPELGIALVIATASSALWVVASAPAMLVAYKSTLRTQPRAEDWGFIEGFSKVTAAEHITSFSEFSDEEIRNMFVGDFFALCGKTVMRHGGTHGTRRLLTELDIGPNSRVLEIGTGVGTSAFDLIAADPTIHVTGVDLSAFMVESSKRRIDEKVQTFVATGGVEAEFRNRLAFVHTSDPNVMPFPDNSFDVVLVEAVASYNDPRRFFPEILRVLKPGGRVGLHDWCWTMEPSADLEVHVCVMACGCNPGEMKFFTQNDWEQGLQRQGFDIRFAEQYPFTFFSWGTMADDEGTWPLIKMFARVFSRRAIAQRMMRMMFFLMRHEGAFGYTITVGQKPKQSAALAGHDQRPAPVEHAARVALVDG
ncbi:MAG: class I SAM-dependent methyltransferase [Kofleriaceae bacterium]